jgi:hypothetical protein
VDPFLVKEEGGKTMFALDQTSTNQALISFGSKQKKDESVLSCSTFSLF